jgi:hypothetical protein
MRGFSGKPRTDDECGPGGIFIEKVAEGFEEKREVLLVRFPAAHGDDLILFGDGGVELKDIGLNGVGNTVNLFWVRTKAASEGFPKCGGMRGFYRHCWEKFKSAGQAGLDPRGSEDGGERVEN